MAGSFSTSSFNGGMPTGDRPSRGVGRATTAQLTAARPKPSMKKVMPEIWKLVQPRVGLLSVSFALMVINRATGLVLPGSMRYLIDNVMTRHQVSLLPKIVGIVVAATIIQAITSYTLTQLLSKAGQRLITDLRTQVQAHIGRLSVAFFDENRTGTLVARIMTDVEGVRNLIGTGRGGLLRRHPDGGVRVRLPDPPERADDAADVCDPGSLSFADFAEGVQDDPADLSRAGEDQCRGDGAADGIAWRGARGEGISRGRQRGAGVCGGCAAAAAECDFVA